MGSAVPTAPQGAPAADVGTVIAPAAKSEASPSPRLPGVIPDDGLAPAGPIEPAASPSSQPGRDANGRFVKADAAPQPPVGDDTLESRTPAKPAEDAEQPLEQKYKSLQGQFKPVMGLAKALGGIDQITPKFQQAVNVANDWKAKAEALEAELAAVKGETAKPSKPVDTSAETEGFNWELWKQIKKIANESGTPEDAEAAEKWHAKESERVIQARVDKLLSERLKPFEEEKAADQTYAQYEQSFGELAGIKDASGKLAYPELSDPAQAYEVGKLWAAMDLPPEHAMTPKGALASVALYRMVRSYAGSQDASTTTPSEVIGEGEPTDTAAAAALSDGRPTVIKGANGAVSNEAANIVASLRSMNAGTKDRTHLGFEA